MKIAYIVSNHLLNRGANTGYARHISKTISGLEKRGHSIKVMVSFVRDNLGNKDSNDGLKGFYKFKNNYLLYFGNLRM